MSDPIHSHEPSSTPSLPLLALEGVVVFPHTVVSLALDDAMLPMVDAALKGDRRLLLVARRPDSDTDADTPLRAQIFDIGVVARIEQSGVLPNGSNGIVVRGMIRAEIGDALDPDHPWRFSFALRPDHVVPSPQLEALILETRAVIDAVLELRPGVSQEVRNFVRSIEDPGHLADNTGYSPDYTFAERQDLLETFDLIARLTKVRDFYRVQLALLEVQNRIRNEVQESAAKQQRDFFLRQQIRAIQKELGDDDDEVSDLDDLRAKLARAQMSDVVRKEADRELNRLQRLNESSPEYQMVRTYLEWLAELPWNNPTGSPIDIGVARQVLDEDHYGLTKIKERILEYLAVKQRRAELGDDHGRAGREPILAFVGPPGVGKTSLGQSIARALGRNFVRMSLGGVRDEAELRGFRRTYIGSQPGRLIQELRRAGSSDPVILLDEIDKLGNDYRGDPASALLEVLDPEQNNTFTDHYLNLPFDLSQVLFIATANSWDNVPPALRDRMEVIDLSGYIEDEKVQIAQTHLVPRQLRANGLRPSEAEVSEAALRTIIGDYTREAGVRNLERHIGGVLRKVTRRLAEQNEPSEAAFVVDPAFVRTALGRQRYYNEAKERIDQPGVATGMVWTPVGGDIIFVEAVAVEGNRELKITGQLGEVMCESAEAALTYVRSRARELGIDPAFFDHHAIHIHVPAGAVPKDGPSAGITMATALASAATGRLVRDDVAMTGEISLRGRVLPIGGIKEKALGAHRAGIRTIILPRRNEGDLDDLPREVFDALTFVPVDTLDQVLQTALHPPAMLNGLRSSQRVAEPQYVE
ncbi:ATP-dependent protease La [Oscillochloris trichoides DG-6]|uniref:Lon protease n=1 Tax=Oscillochloris trichoides DG-6 TaxID=765420 RepID=E1IED3_9CHLR|nr:endopeptidase La [Oscillochloris trichoides]EFO80459.1 ATP-dependent protease La [Oscillochloris trichoides DG-6]